MSGNDGSIAARQFVASSSVISAKWGGKRMYMLSYAGWGLLVVAFGAVFLLHLGGAGMVAILVVMFGGSIAVGGYLWWRSTQKVIVEASGGGVTVSTRPGDVFPVAEAKLGPWVTSGVALHLQSGSRTFILGGRNRRIEPFRV